jgi:hypothetical protein
VTGGAFAWMACFDDEESLARAIEALVERGFSVSPSAPFESDRLSEAMGTGRSRIPLAAFAAAILGGMGAWSVQWLTRNAGLPLDVGGRPRDSAWADLPIIFETTVLAAVVTAFVLLLVRSGLPRLHHPWFDVAGFDTLGFWLAVEPTDGAAEDELVELLTALGARAIGPLRDTESLDAPEDPP